MELAARVDQSLGRVVGAVKQVPNERVGVVELGIRRDHDARLSTRRSLERLERSAGRRRFAVLCRADSGPAAIASPTALAARRVSLGLGGMFRTVVSVGPFPAYNPTTTLDHHRDDAEDLEMRIGFWLAAATLSIAAATARAQGVVTQRILSLAAARLIADAALAACAARGFHTSVVVVDRSGDVLVVLRDELAHPVTVEMARSKAYTAVVFRTSTTDFRNETASDATRLPQRDVPGIVALGGGLPIYSGGEIIGAVASSGSSQTTDDECAKAGVAKGASLLE